MTIDEAETYSAIARRKNIPFYPARNGRNFSYFQLARLSFRFPSQLISQYFFFQLAQILPEERVFCRAAPLGTPDEALADIFWRIDSSGAGLMESLGHKKKSSCFFLYLFFPFLFFSFQAFNSYPAWKNLPDCIKIYKASRHWNCPFPHEI